MSVDGRTVTAKAAKAKAKKKLKLPDGLTFRDARRDAFAEGTFDGSPRQFYFHEGDGMIYTVRKSDLGRITRERIRSKGEAYQFLKYWDRVQDLKTIGWGCPYEKHANERQAQRAFAEILAACRFKLSCEIDVAIATAQASGSAEDWQAAAMQARKALEYSDFRPEIKA